jgi:hypothetical protein
MTKADEITQAIHQRLARISDVATGLGAAIEAEEVDVPALHLASALVRLDGLAGELEDVHDLIVNDLIVNDEEPGGEG